jgi:hypothetical protein
MEDRISQLRSAADKLESSGGVMPEQDSVVFVALLREIADELEFGAEEMSPDEEVEE